MMTWQDYGKARDKAAFLHALMEAHEAGEEVKTARVADLYDRRRNVTINEFVRKVYTLSGMPVADYTAGGSRIASNFFARLNTQRAAYSLGNGVTFADPETGRRLGGDFDTRLFEAGRLALIHGTSFLFLNVEGVSVFPLTGFAPLWDEETGELRAGLRYWRLDERRPVRAVFYGEDGRQTLAEGPGGFLPAGRKQAYRRTVQLLPDGGERVIAEENYAALPVVPLFGSRYRQSTLVGMRQAIDSFDLIRSGFADDLSDCAQIYWLLENAGELSDEELARFRDRLKFQHIATADTGAEGRITPYTQEVPYEARMAYLDHMRRGIYEDFGALDVSQLSSSSRTATEIQAAYQPLDEQADDFEYQVIECVRRLLALLGIEDTPVFKRNRMTNQKEQAELVLLEAAHLDEETLLAKLPNITKDEVPEILKRRKLK